MSYSEESPPPLPASPPPGPPSPMEKPGRKDKKEVRSSSEHFKSLQTMLSGAKGMYTSPSRSGSSPAPPPNKKLLLETALDLDESPKLSHINKGRPKRKVRPPTRVSIDIGTKAYTGETGQTNPMLSLNPTAETGELNEEDAPVPPPPLPTSAPPEVPSEASLLVASLVPGTY